MTSKKTPNLLNSLRAAVGRPIAALSGITFLLLAMMALLAPFIAPVDPTDLASINLSNAFLPPFSRGVEGTLFLLGADAQGRDVFSMLLFGMRLSIGVAVASVFLAVSVGTLLGTISGYLQGLIDSIIMRVGDVQLAIPALMVAMLIDGLTKAALGDQLGVRASILVIIVAIGATYWVHYARVARSATLVEKTHEYVLYARLLQRPTRVILASHITPNVAPVILVIATINMSTAILTEAGLSFLGLGIPVTEPSLGTMVREGQAYVFSGEWWIVVFPGLALALLIISINLFGDELRDVLDPTLN